MATKSFTDILQCNVFFQSARDYVKNKVPVLLSVFDGEGCVSVLLMAHYLIQVLYKKSQNIVKKRGVNVKNRNNL